MFNIMFFQAEGGIRDVAVTGVQTCALPISPPTSRIVGVALHHHLDVVLRALGGVALANDALGPGWRDKASDHRTQQRIRSEERRVGKEWRVRCSPNNNDAD